MKRKNWLILCMIVSLVACAPHVIRPKGAMQTFPGVAPSEVEGAYVPRRMALLVGINSFDDKRWRPLFYAEQDARDLSSVLSNPAQSHFDDVKVLAGPSQTTRAAILDAIDRIARENTNQNDTVVIYFSTHGTLERDFGGNIRQYLVARDTRFDNIARTGIDLADIKARFGSLKSRRKALIIASCHSGQGKSELNDRMANELRHTKAGFFVKPIDMVSEASVVLSACAWGETAREDDRLSHDIYTYFFIEALKTADRNEDGAVTISEAHDLAREKTYYFTRGEQRPSVISDILGSDPIVLSGRIKRPGKPVIYSYNETMNGVQVVVDGTPKGKLPGSIALEPGVHRVSLVTPDGSLELFSASVALPLAIRVDAMELIKEVHNQQSMGMGVSYRAFISNNVSETLYAPIMTYGLIYSHYGPLKNTQWDIGLFGGSDVETLTVDGIEHRADLTRIDLEVDMMWEYRRGKLRLAGGPIIGLVFLERRFHEGRDDSDQYNVTGLIGPMGSIEFSPYRGWIIGLGGDFNMAQLTANSRGRLEMGYAATVYVKRNFGSKF